MTSSPLKVTGAVWTADVGQFHRILRAWMDLEGPITDCTLLHPTSPAWGGILTNYMPRFTAYDPSDPTTEVQDVGCFLGPISADDGEAWRHLADFADLCMAAGLYAEILLFFSSDGHVVDRMSCWKINPDQGFGDMAYTVGGTNLAGYTY